MSIHFQNETNTFYLDGKDISYVFCINEFQYAEHLYFGSKIPHEPIFFTRATGATACLAVPPAQTPLKGFANSYHHFLTELSFFGTGDYREPTVLVENQIGDRLSDLLYDGYEIVPCKPPIDGIPSMNGGETLILHLRDRISDFCADLYYTVYDDVNVIARRIVYRNAGNAPAVLRRAYSFALSLPNQQYNVLSLYGAWGRERRIEQLPLHHGVVSVDSKRTASSSTLNPFLAILSHDTTETQGEVWGVSLVYSSSFVLKAEGTSSGETLVTGGINDFDFSWTLEAGESFATPEAVIAYSAHGLGEMSRTFHDAWREHLINRRYVKASRPLLINNWEATYFQFDNERLMKIVDAVADTGIDTFVLDDGWFGKRDNDKSGLGDWTVNRQKLVGGLDTIIRYVHSKGMKFGLWFEPEMISEDSDLYRAHPDYAIAAPNRIPCRSRNQLMLDLTRKDVRDTIVESVNRILHEYAIEYVKWDYNRNVTESFSFGRDARRQAEFAHRYALGLYDLCDRIVAANPNVFFEGCAGGGARFDPAMLHYFPQIWTSDDTDAEERTHIQYGTSLVYPLSAMSCHISICPNHQTHRTTSFGTRAAIAHLGATGYELDTSSFTDEDRDMVRQQTAEYKKCEHLILEGDLYRIENPMQSNYFAWSVVAKDQSSAILLAYRRLNQPNGESKRIRMAGLDPHKRYFVPELDLTLSGATLMNVGIAQKFKGEDFSVLKYHFTEV